MLSDTIKANVIAAMKTGDSLQVSVLRMLQSAISYKQIDVQHDLSDEEILLVIGNEAKKRREAIESYDKAGRAEQAAQEKAELAFLQAYLPAQMTEEEIKAEINKLELPNDFGQAMKIVSPMFKGKADGGLVARLVKEKIANA
jgi:uncharacterized protein